MKYLHGFLRVLRGFVAVFSLLSLRDKCVAAASLVRSLAAAPLLLPPAAHSPRYEAFPMATNVTKLIKDNNVEYVDLRFADMLGKQHHVTFPARTVDEAFFEEGKMF